MKWFLALNLFLTIFGRAALGDGSTSITAPCTAKEEWNLSSNIPETSRKELLGLLERAKEESVKFQPALAQMDRSMRLFKSEKSTEAKLLAGYAMARTYLSLGYEHLAFQLFQSFLMKFPGTQKENLGPKLGMVGCLNQIKRETHSLSLDPLILSSLEEMAKMSPNAWLAATLPKT